VLQQPPNCYADCISVSPQLDSPSQAAPFALWVANDKNVEWWERLCPMWPWRFNR
jgi:hypothetical protein